MPAPPDRLRLLHTLSGVFPVGLFLVAHLITQAKVLSGGAAYEREQVGMTTLAIWPFIEVVVLASLAFHAAFGVWLVFQGARPSRWYAGRPRLALLQRVTGIAALAFIAWHLMLRLERARGEISLGGLYPTLVASLSSTTTLGIPLIALGYLLGVAACAFHFSNGVASFVTASGVATSARGRRRLTIACALLGTALFLAGADTTVALATGARHFVR